ncbi:MAG TPA: ATPase, T2SS/T4P/T4SS family [Candidatus Hydrogenedentes bacterium]|nr:ATPase, T2SS/T4P/T4SS family [Candidatus Hydrogenedentota bacterium]HOV74457.1 ATPase, T2SS/T4P/T4SS family [Candidatus Hydrogenedentota bacterium]HPC17251.1 ATPase, T2SS/T4P/T4SS family [Candidatus Hydrogenedentota bacterium]HRT21166.1 ATPase, T2SS/T4P/T4SS family [Candidatus Hydrogenedentota bacterium]HRT65947.1 ATPase, T2SS/T4P/T4SS family [Candidatus Hydrogenedentota bacterium]
MAVREKRLGDILIEQGVISPLELDEATQRQRLTGEMMGRVLVSMGLCEEQDIVEALGIQMGMERVDLPKLKIRDEVLRRIPPDVARFYNIVPIREVNGTLVVAMADPLNLRVLDDLRQLLGCDVKGAISNHADVAASIKANYTYESQSIHETLKEIVAKVGDSELTEEELGQQKIIGDTENLVELAQEPEVIKIVNLVLLEAVQKHASDIHFEIYEDYFRIRLRIDGALEEIVSPPKNMSLALVSRVKVMCNMDIGERRLPQDARIELKVGDSEIDIRVATLPTLFGECLVMRILDRTAVKIDLKVLGFSPEVKKSVERVIAKPNGIFLVTGPTGSGKTTTLYACLNEINSPEVKIITTEDPVELQIERLVQVQIKEEIGLTFASCLRAILRQDPDIIMVGEIRDLETAEIAVEASLTGHLVLSTLHTNSAPETITRLLDMDVEPFLITASLEAVLAQRLLRTLCRHCREKYAPDQEEMDRLGLPEAWRKNPKLRFYRPKGCPGCDFKGYMGRTGLFEMLVVDERICEMILDRAMSYEIRKYARKYQGMRTLREEGIIKCVQGITSVEEVIAHTDAYDDE